MWKYNQIFDSTGNTELYPGSSGFAVDRDGNQYVRISDTEAVDVKTWELHIVNNWSDDRGTK